MGRGRRAVEVVLTGAERETLERWARRPKSSQALALRCRIVLGAAGGETNKSMAARLGCSEATVSKWRRRFARRRLDGLADDPRPGPPRTITDEMVEEVIVRTLESAPAGATHWSTRSMAAAVAPTPQSKTSKTPSTPGSTTGTKTPNPSHGARPPTRHSTTYHHIYNEFQTQDARPRSLASRGRGGAARRTRCVVL